MRNFLCYLQTQLKKISLDNKKTYNLSKMGGGGRTKVTFYDLRQDKWAGYPATLNLSSGFDSSLVSGSKSSIISFQKDNVEEFSLLSDNEKNEKNIHHSNNRQ